jgi:hypothetical protein
MRIVGMAMALASLVLLPGCIDRSPERSEGDCEPTQWEFQWHQPGLFAWTEENAANLGFRVQVRGIDEDGMLDAATEWFQGNVELERIRESHPEITITMEPGPEDLFVEVRSHWTNEALARELDSFLQATTNVSKDYREWIVGDTIQSREPESQTNGWDSASAYLNLWWFNFTVQFADLWAERNADPEPLGASRYAIESRGMSVLLRIDSKLLSWDGGDLVVDRLDRIAWDYEGAALSDSKARRQVEQDWKSLGLPAPTLTDFQQEPDGWVCADGRQIVENDS